MIKHSSAGLKAVILTIEKLLEGLSSIRYSFQASTMCLRGIIMLESKFKAKQRQEFETMGWKFIVLDPGAGVPTGFPDTICISPTGYTCFTEWKKSKTAKKQPLQDYWNKKLKEMGHDAFFVYPANCDEWRAEVIRKSENYGKTIR